MPAVVDYGSDFYCGRCDVIVGDGGFPGYGVEDLAVTAAEAKLRRGLQHRQKQQSEECRRTCTGIVVSHTGDYITHDGYISYLGAKLNKSEQIAK